VTRRSVVFTAQVVAIAASLAAWLALALLVLTTDPDASVERLFALCIFVGAGGFGTAFILALTHLSGPPVLHVLRGFRRGILFGLACAGAAVLQMNSSLTAPNMAFLLLVLLIVEMIFLARRQNVPQ
jgi:hypothetical protein